MQYNLCLDLGNSRCKIAVFEAKGVKPVEQYHCQEENLISALEKLNNQYAIQNAILSTVIHEPDGLKEWLDTHCAFWLTLQLNTRLPFVNAYSSADTLGADRLALAAGALALYPEQASLVIALGTCITYNLVLANKFYRGGAIAPGLQMRFQALKQFTDKLPLVSAEGDSPILGYDTETSIRSGVVNGIVSEIAGMCAIYQQEMRDQFNPILTGGDLAFFEPKIKNKIFAAPDILMIGLQEILKHNVPLF